MSSPGFCYLMHIVGTGEYKIGRSKNPDVRLISIGYAVGQSVELVHAIPSPEPSRLERYLHYVFEGDCIGGEWFSLSDEQVELIKAIQEDPGLDRPKPICPIVTMTFNFQRLVELRQARGVSRYRLAKDTGINQQTLANLESVESQPTAATLAALAQYFGVAMEELMREEHPRNSSPSSQAQ